MHTQLKDCLFFSSSYRYNRKQLCERANVCMCWNFKQWICNMMIFDTSHLSKYTIRWKFVERPAYNGHAHFSVLVLLILGLHSEHAHIQIQTQNAVWIHNWWHVVINAHDFNGMLLVSFVSFLFYFLSHNLNDNLSFEN